MEERTLSRKVWEAASRWATFSTLLIAIIGYSIGDHRMLLNHEAIIQAYENHGTPQSVKLTAQTEEKFKAIEGKQEEKFKGIERRLELLEQIAVTIPDIRVEMVKVSAKLDGMNEALKHHMEEKPK